MPLVSSPRILLLFLCIIADSFFLRSIRADAQVSQTDKTFKFSLAAVAKLTKVGRSQIIPLSDNILLESGSLIKFYLEIESQGWFYLFHEGPRGKLVRVFPKDSQPAFVLECTPVYVPEAASWIELDSNTGKETFHLIVSAVPLERLENLYNQHTMLEKIPDINQSAAAILNEIKLLKGKNLVGRAEKPVILAGKLRGDSSGDSISQQTLMNFASEISTAETYVKSIIIDHK